MLIFSALAALGVASGNASVDPALAVLSPEQPCCTLTIQLPEEDVPCLIRMLRNLERDDAESAEALQRMLNEKAEACRRDRENKSSAEPAKPTP